MKQLLLGQGGVRVEEVPVPRAEAGTVLVQVSHSCISPGTEMSGVKESNLPLWRRALRRPAQVKRLLEVAASEGLAQTRSLVRSRLESLQPAGYSASGIVLDVGEGIDDFAPGDRVACAGAQCAHHAEIIRVPRNLAVPVPADLAGEAAATVTLGAIALQGVRRAQPTLGETFVVIGLGLLGQLTQQILQANGCRVAGVDLDRRRIETALGMGMGIGIHPDEGDAVEQVMRLTGGAGADGVIVTAATPSSEPISQAFRMCRRKARVVVVGEVGLALDRADIYAKELDFLISTSYGPGRYDRTYEEAGLDYPLAYVRWTENRNMEAYLRLLADGRVRVDTLLDRVYPIEEAAAAYADLSAGAKDRPLAVLLSYSGGSQPPLRRVANPRARSGHPGALRIALVGPGGFAMSTYAPILRSATEAYSVRAVVARQGHSALSSARQLGAAYSSTDFAEVLADPDVDAVMITTRHDLHGPMVLRALEAGKHVLVEKPLCLTEAELEAISAFYAATSSGPLLMTGFNRRFSPVAVAAAAVLAGRCNPMMIEYRVNAGHIPRDSWVHGPEGGGRNRGEACHFYDLFTCLTGSRVRDVSAMSIVPATAHYAPDDNFVATMRFEDGSLATLTYTALGAREHPKEQATIYADGKVLTIDDYKRFVIVGSRGKGIDLKRADKGHRAELLAFARVVREGGEWPIPLWQQIQATEIALLVDEQLSRQRGDTAR